MPRLVEISGYIIYFWSNEGNEPCHVHVSRKRAVKNATKIWIEPKISVAHNKSKISKKDMTEILLWITNNRKFILEQWNKYFQKKLS